MMKVKKPTSLIRVIKGFIRILPFVNTSSDTFGRNANGYLYSQEQRLKQIERERERERDHYS